jgi:hypothetical protein
MKKYPHETAGRKQNKPEIERPDPKTLRVFSSQPPTIENIKEIILAETVVKPENNSAFVITDYPITGDAVGVTELADCIQAATAKIKAGDMSEAEAMLFSQAKALEAIFTSLTRRASKQGLMCHYQMYLTLALKAQSQSRSTLQALTELKFPRQVIMKQTNVANGAQQINNAGDIQESAVARTPENKNLKNKLSPQIEDTRHERQTLDVGTATKTSRNDSVLATLGKVNRAKNISRQN